MQKYWCDWCGSFDSRKECLVKEGYNGTPQIKLNESIRASLDPSYDENVARYKEQNEYTAYNGR